MMANLNDLPADRQADIRLKLTRMYGHQEKAHKEASEACAIFKTLVVDKDIDLNTLRTFAEGTFRLLVAMKIPDVDRYGKQKRRSVHGRPRLGRTGRAPSMRIIEEQNLPQRPGKDTARPQTTKGKVQEHCRPWYTISRMGHSLTTIRKESLKWLENSMFQSSRSSV